MNNLHQYSQEITSNFFKKADIFEENLYNAKYDSSPKSTIVEAAKRKNIMQKSEDKRTEPYAIQLDRYSQQGRDIRDLTLDERAELTQAYLDMKNYGANDEVEFSLPRKVVTGLLTKQAESTESANKLSTLKRLQALQEKVKESIVEKYETDICEELDEKIERILDEKRYKRYPYTENQLNLFSDFQERALAVKQWG